LNDNHIKAVHKLSSHTSISHWQFLDYMNQNMVRIYHTHPLMMVLYKFTLWKSLVYSIWKYTAELVKVYDNLNFAVFLWIKAQIASIAHSQAHSITLEIQNTQLQRARMTVSFMLLHMPLISALEMIGLIFVITKIS